MPNITSISLQNCNNVTNMRHMCDGNITLTREPSGVKYDKVVDAYCIYYHCEHLRPPAVLSFPVCKNLEGSYEKTLWDECPSYTVNAPVADTIGYMLHWVPTINTTVINVGNPAVSLHAVASWPSTYNYNTCDVKINCASPLTGDHFQAFMYRAGMTKFPFGVSVGGDTMALNLLGNNTNGMFVNCLALKLPTNGSTRNINVSIPNSIDARQMFTRDYLWGDPNAALPLNVNVQVPNALDIFNLVWIEKRPSGHIDYLTINAPKATSANYCVGSLVAINGYNINIPVAVPVPVPIYNADNMPVDPSNIVGPIDERILSKLDTYTGDIHIYNCPSFYPRYINNMLNAKGVYLHNCTILSGPGGIVEKPSTIPLHIYFIGRTFTDSVYINDPTWKSYQNLLGGIWNFIPAMPNFYVADTGHVKWFRPHS